MTLRRCDSLPTQLREPPAAPPEKDTDSPAQLLDSSTNPDFKDLPPRDEVVATWKSLYTDVKKIKNGFPVKNDESKHTLDKKEYATNNATHTFASNNKARKITYANRHTTFRPQQGVDHDSSFPLDDDQSCPTARRASTARRRTLLERLLSWRIPEIPECEFRERCNINLRSTAPKHRAEDLLCTCGASRPTVEKHSKYAERGRSKSVGYEAAREVTQFRRCASAGATVGAETAAALRARAALTLARRYYPEGGWGWTITVVGTIVQILSHGLQLGGGTGAIACTAAVKYRVSPLFTYAGSKIKWLGRTGLTVLAQKSSNISKNKEATSLSRATSTTAT